MDPSTEFAASLRDSYQSMQGIKSALIDTGLSGSVPLSQSLRWQDGNLEGSFLSSLADWHSGLTPEAQQYASDILLNYGGKKNGKGKKPKSSSLNGYGSSMDMMQSYSSSSSALPVTQYGCHNGEGKYGAKKNRMSPSFSGTDSYYEQMGSQYGRQFKGSSSYGGRQGSYSRGGMNGNGMNGMGMGGYQ